MSGADEAHVSFTTKELLARIDEKVDRIEVKLDKKADRERLHEIGNRMSGLDSRVTLLEANVVRREGPIVKRFEDFEDALRELETNALTTKQIEDALHRNDERRAKRSDRILSKTNVTIALVCAAIVVVNFVLQQVFR